MWCGSCPGAAFGARASPSLPTFGSELVARTLSNDPDSCLGARPDVQELHHSDGAAMRYDRESSEGCVRQQRQRRPEARRAFPGAVLPPPKGLRRKCAMAGVSFKSWFRGLRPPRRHVAGGALPCRQVRLGRTSVRPRALMWTSCMLQRQPRRNDSNRRRRSLEY